jgi:glucosamine--fructose-6-phosphate aminotransferase (isomerizing)
MCGIFSIVLNNNENIYDLIISGLVQLQNRGYDSAGISVMNDKTIEVHKYASTSEEDSIIKLKNLGLGQKEKFYIGIGHNRWATHGVKNDKNAHPHLSNNKNFSIVHNGIIENYNDLKKILIINNFTFTSQTDTEVVVNLIELNYRTTNNTFEAIKKTISSLRGTYGLVIQSLYEPNALFCVKNGSPLLVGQNDNCVIVTSEQSGFCNMMNNYITLHSDDICVIRKTNENILFTTSHIYTTNNVSVLDTELSPFPYEHWTIKEIYEQPNVVLNSINKGGRIKNQSEVKLGGLEQHMDSLLYIKNIIILGF